MRVSFRVTGGFILNPKNKGRERKENSFFANPHTTGQPARVRLPRPVTKRFQRRAREGGPPVRNGSLHRTRPRQANASVSRVASAGLLIRAAPTEPWGIPGPLTHPGPGRAPLVVGH